jgi:hypothetical protein
VTLQMHSLAIGAKFFPADSISLIIGSVPPKGKLGFFRRHPEPWGLQGKQKTAYRRRACAPASDWEFQLPTPQKICQKRGVNSPLHILMPTLCLAGGWFLSSAWPERPPPLPDGGAAGATLQASRQKTIGQKPESAPEPGDPGVESLPAAALALAGLESAPDLEDIFKVEGADRRLRVALFLQNADYAGCQALLARLNPADALVPAPAADKMEYSLSAGVWERWVEVDHAAAVLWNQGDSPVWSAWAGVDSESALAAARGNPRHLAEVIRVLGRRNPAQARELIAAHPELTGDAGIWRGVAENLALRDPAAAVALAYENKSGWQEILTQWSAGNPGDALAWASALKDGPEKRRSTETVIREWTRADPAAGLSAARKLPVGQSAKILTSEALQALARKDPEAAKKGLTSIPETMGRQVSAAAVADGLRTSDPQAAFEVLRQVRWNAFFRQHELYYSYSTRDSGGGARVPAGDGARVMHERILEEFAILDPRATAEAILPQAGIGEGTYALSITLGEWLSVSPEEASAWIRDLPAGSGRDTGIESLSRYLIDGAESSDFQSALAWAATARPDKRQPLLEEILGRWRKVDASAAAGAAADYGVNLTPVPPAADSDPFAR